MMLPHHPAHARETGMTDHPEEQGFRPIGSHLPRTEILPPRSNSTQTPPPQSSATTGAPSLAARGSSSIGLPPTATDAESLPSVVPAARYSALDRQPESPKDLRTRSEQENRTKIAGHITRLLAHFWAANEDSRLRAALAQDWLADLCEFSESVVADACQAWRRSESRRPTIADIRLRCIERRQYQQPTEPAPVLDRAAAAKVAEFHERRYQDAAEAREAWARSHGVASFQLAMQVGLVAVSKMPLVSDWESA